MKKIVYIWIFGLMLAACSNTAQTPTPTSTQLVIPVLQKISPSPTATPVITTPTATITPALSPTPEIVTYVVQAGDNLGSIAQKYGTTVESLVLENNIDNPNIIFPGQTLIIKPVIMEEKVLKSVPPTPDTIEGKEIVVVLHSQRAYAFEKGIEVKMFVVSTGVVDHPTKIGRFRIMVKLDFDDMTDNITYNLPNVPWVMYFGNDDVSWHEGYSLHGTYWHNNFGTPMSHGCVNFKIEDAKWIYFWSNPVPSGGETDSTKANPGTVVLIIP